jgi:adenine-specific DNA methylase
MTDTRLIERWLPIAELGEECDRERRSMTSLPPVYYLHVWWARRPLVASRAAVLASLLPSDANEERFLHALGIHGDPVGARAKIERAKRTGVRVKDPYGYERAFKHVPSSRDIRWFETERYSAPQDPAMLDPTAGGGSIPFEAMRVGLEPQANDLNPVAGLTMKATVEWPAKWPAALVSEFEELAKHWRHVIEERLGSLYSQTDLPERVDITHLWARTVTCPYCEGLVPLSPNWRLTPDGTGVRLLPNEGEGPGSSERRCSFEIVESEEEQSPETVARGDGTCPFADCGRVIDGDEIKEQAQAGHMGEQLYAVVYKQRLESRTKTGKIREKWVRGYRAPRPEDDNSAEIASRLAAKLPEWEAFDIVPSETIPDGLKTAEPQRYGMRQWRDLFSSRQLLSHGTSVEIFREMLEADRSAGHLDAVRKAAYAYLALTLDKLLNYNSRMSVWMPTREVVANTFNRHDFAFCWSYAEMVTVVTGLGYDWAIQQTAKSIRELVQLVHADAAPASGAAPTNQMRLSEPGDSGDEAAHPVTITCKPAESLDHIEDASIDAVIMDPPYYDNVMYAELSDFFYVWLKRTAGSVFPELFRRRLTDKENEAVANPARFKGQKGAKLLAGRDYQKRMGAIFRECARVLKPDGIMTLMFTHKASGAWDALTTGLMEAGFRITASWPINTEAASSLHIKDKAAAKSTIFLVCRPPDDRKAAKLRDGATYWEDVELEVAKAVRRRVAEFQAAGIRGVDLYLACFGPALQLFSEHWPLRRGTPREPPTGTKRRGHQAKLQLEETDPYAVTPEDALDVARREVKRWRLEQLTHLKANVDLDPVTAFFVLAWDAFDAPIFSYDEALRLARATGVDLDRDVVGRLALKNRGNLRLWDSERRAARGVLGPADGSRGMIDAIHHAAHIARNRSLEEARDRLVQAQIAEDPLFLAAFEAVLEVLPLSAAFTGVSLKGEIAASSSDFEALYNLRRFAFADKIDEPEQLAFWRQDAT